MKSMSGSTSHHLNGTGAGAKAGLHVAVVGATGAVGREMVALLEDRALPVATLSAFASPRSEGDTVLFRNQEVRLRTPGSDAFRGVDVVLGATSASVARDYVPQALAAGALVIDNSSAFRMEPDIPLVVPEVNGQALEQWRNRRIVANPNCTTAQLVVALKPLHEAAGLERVVISSYQSTSGTGQKGMEALSEEVLALYRSSHLSQAGGDDAASEEEDDAADLEAPDAPEMRQSHRFVDSPYPVQIAFNGIPQIGDFDAHGVTGEEQKVIQESRKILELPDLRLTATCVRVPWFACHALSVNVELRRPLSPARAREVLAAAPGVVLEDRPAEGLYPTPFFKAGTDPVYVGRVRQDFSLPNGLNLWVVADNLRKGAALNAVQILERWLEVRGRA